jgi:hypothetical protein
LGGPANPAQAWLFILQPQQLTREDETRLRQEGQCNNRTSEELRSGRRASYNMRAGIAFMGLGADQQEDTVYPTAYVDSDGNPLDSAHKYVMHYEKGRLPPTNAAWSVSQYQGNFYVVNVLNRYAIAPWMPLNYNADGSLDIYTGRVAGQGQGSQLAADAAGPVQHHDSQLLAQGSGGAAELQAMLTYSLLITIYLVYLGGVARLAGMLLWPAVAVPVVFMLLLVAAWRHDRQRPAGSTPRG